MSGAGAGVGSGASAASSGASESDSGTVAGDSGRRGRFAVLLPRVDQLARAGGGGGHMSLAAGDARSPLAAPDACLLQQRRPVTRGARLVRDERATTNVNH